MGVLGDQRNGAPPRLQEVLRTSRYVPYPHLLDEPLRTLKKRGTIGRVRNPPNGHPGCHEAI